MATMALFWFIFGGILLLLEFLLPGLVVIFLGASAVLVGLALSLGWIEGLSESLMTWFISSIVLILSLRGALLKFAPTGKVSVAELNDQESCLGKIVTVAEDVGLNKGGRIFFQGTTWPAVTTEGQIPKGAKARVLVRLNVTYVVEPISEIDLLEEVEGPVEQLP